MGDTATVPELRPHRSKVGGGPSLRVAPVHAGRDGTVQRNMVEDKGTEDDNLAGNNQLILDTEVKVVKYHAAVLGGVAHTLV